MQIDDPMLKQTILNYIVRRIEASEFGELIDEGYPPQLVEDLRRRSAADLSHISDLGLPIQVHVDPKDLAEYMQRYERAIHRVGLMDYFLAHGAHPDLVSTLFDQLSSDMRERRKLLVSHRISLRQAIPDDDDVSLIQLHETWRQACGAHSGTVDRIYAVHKSLPAFSINAIVKRIEKDFGTYHTSPTTQNESRFAQ